MSTENLLFSTGGGRNKQMAALPHKAAICQNCEKSLTSLVTPTQPSVTVIFFPSFPFPLLLLSHPTPHFTANPMLTSARDAVVRFWHTRVHFIELHYLYIAFLIFVASGLFYCQPGTDWNYVDSLFMATTAATNTGLNTIAMSALSTYQMLVIFFLSLIGSQITISYVVLIVRRHYFSKRFEDILKFNKARRQREEQRRRERRKKDSDIELGSSGSLKIRRRLSLSSTATTTAAAAMRRRMSLSSIASSPVSGSKGHGGRTKSSWLSKPHEISSFVHQFRSEQREMMDRREAEAKAHDHNDNSGVDLQRQMSTPMHPCQEHERYPNELERVTSTSSTTAGNSGSGRDFSEENAGTQGIAFANNIEQQREIARRRLEQERRFEELMQKISRDDPITDTLVDSDDDEEFEEIMRQPIDKSQLTRQQRYRLGGAEYRALDMLARLVPIYYLGFITVAAFMIRGYIGVSSYAQQVLQTSNPTGPVDPWFFSFFAAVSGMDNLGMCHLDASLVPFQNAPFPLLVIATLILVGNTAYAILLRFLIWVLYKLTPHHETMRRETFRYLLDHPRRCYTLLFQSTQTWWLLIILICITIAELVCFIAFNYWLPVTADLTWGSRVLDGLFQSIATRNAGFAVISLGDLNPGTQLVYIIAMYISVYPVAISMRNSNVYQVQLLLVYNITNDFGFNAIWIYFCRNVHWVFSAERTRSLCSSPRQICADLLRSSNCGGIQQSAAS